MTMTGKTQFRTRLQDVAARAGVAVNTASMILNRRPNSWASKETEERVFKAAAELNYRPSRAAVGLRLGKFNTIGLVVPDLQNPFYTGLSDILEREFAPHGYDLIIESSHGDVAREKKCLESIIDRQVDGIVCVLMDTEAHRVLLEQAFTGGKPVVAVAEAAELPADCLTVNFTEGLRQAIRHIADLGHRRAAFLLALAKGQNRGTRADVFCELMAECGILGESVACIECDHTIAGAREAMRRHLHDNWNARPTAVIAQTDLAGIGAIRAAVDLGLNVPHHLSVIGMDNTPLGEHLPVALTTVEQPAQDLMSEAVELLLKRLGDPFYGGPQRREFGTRLVVRESTAPPTV
jgi:LacI family transcriptional regulator, galactose operon repressor